MTTTVGAARKGEYAILRSPNHNPESPYRYFLIEVHAATRDGKVKRYRDYGRTGNPYTETQVRQAPGTIFAIGDVWVKPTRETFGTMEDLLIDAQIYVKAPLVTLDRETK